MSKRVTIKELGNQLAAIEGRDKPIAPKNIRKSLSAHGVRVGKDHKVDLAAAMDARAQGKEEDRSAIVGTSMTGKLKDKKLFTEIEILELKRDTIRGEYIAKAEHRMAMAELCEGIVSVIENYRRRKDARDRDPKRKKILDECIAEVRNALAESVARLGIESVATLICGATCEAISKVSTKGASDADLQHLAAMEQAVQAELGKLVKKMGITPNVRQ
jgi:hypothetical protein